MSQLAIVHGSVTTFVSGVWEADFVGFISSSNLWLVAAMASDEVWSEAGGLWHFTCLRPRGQRGGSGVMRLQSSDFGFMR